MPPSSRALDDDRQSSTATPEILDTHVLLYSLVYAIIRGLHNAAFSLQHRHFVLCVFNVVLPQARVPSPQRAGSASFLRPARASNLKPARTTPAAKQITKFLNEFEVSVRYKLSTLAERVGSLERHLEYCETAVKNKEQLQRGSSLTAAPAPAGGGR